VTARTVGRLAQVREQHRERHQRKQCQQRSTASIAAGSRSSGTSTAPIAARTISTPAIITSRCGWRTRIEASAVLMHWPR